MPFLNGYSLNHDESSVKDINSEYLTLDLERLLDFILEPIIVAICKCFR